ncbi:hypothetical protein [Draconibacterium sediminis]|uniref:Uncharacterized protein n=1 Tax=Draconibacterium sediminis TaxID=1544798 RepID=A0A0D8JDX0_9BACT|nr:hypothetical protein [Draconibacterium sediminis]KJF44048.1 hypothetical protein LH29_00460 [Draconibacterium sediminis]
MENLPIKFHSVLREEIAPLYFKVKDAIIEAEGTDPLKETYMAPFNELRNTLDHIMKGCMMDSPKDLSNNLMEAKSHLNRAGYDVYEIIVSNIGIDIYGIVSQYKPSVINTVFPKYYNEIQAEILTIQHEIDEIRKNKNVDGDINPGPFESYESKKERLKEIHSIVDSHVAVLEEERKRQERAGFWKRINPYLVRVFGGLLVILLADKLNVLDYILAFFVRAGNP